VFRLFTSSAFRMRQFAQGLLTFTGLFLGSFSATWMKEDAAGRQLNEAEIETREFAEFEPNSRRLGGLWKGAGTNAVGVGCLAIAATETVTVSDAACKDSTACPDCFYLTGTADITLTVTGCNTGKWGTGAAMGTAPIATAVREYVFVNTMTGNRATISDGTISYVIPAASSVSAYCYSAVANTLHFPYNPSVAAAGCPKGCDAATAADIGGTNFGTMTCAQAVDENGAATYSAVCTGAR